MGKIYVLVMRADSAINDANEGNTASFDLAHYIDLRSKEDIVFTLIAETDTGTNPTLDVIIQHSDDDSTWVNGVTFTQVTTNDVIEQKASTFISRFIRASMLVGGTSTPAYATCKLTATFMLRAGGGPPHT